MNIFLNPYSFKELSKVFKALDYNLFYLTILFKTNLLIKKDTKKLLFN